jgi:hypothetical protein
VGTWMSLEDIMLHEVSQAYKGCMMHLRGILKIWSHKNSE